MTLIVAALLLAAAPEPKVLAERDGMRLLLAEGNKATLRFASPGTAVLVIVEGSAAASAYPTPKPLVEGDAVYLPAPGKWTLKPSPTVRAVVLELPAPKGTGKPLIVQAKGAQRYLILSGKGEASIMLDKGLTGSEAVSHGRLSLQAGATVPSHQHPGSAEVLYVVSGGTELTVGSEDKLLRAGEAVIIPAGVQHSARTTSQEPFRALQFYSPGGPEQRFKGPAAAPPDGGTPPHDGGH